MRSRSFLNAAVILLCCMHAEAKVWDITESGAVAKKGLDNTKAIQSAIDACAEAGGGTVYVPAGDYECGGLRLLSNVTLHIEAGATLWVSPKQEHYDHGNRFFSAEGQANITIQGRGRIHGTGAEDLGRKKGDSRPRPDFRVGILRFIRCTNVMIRDVTVQYSDSWTFDLEFCEKVYISGVTILNNYYRVNADGIDPVSCKNVHISDCYIIAGDDCIVCKTREGVPCEDIVVTNCTMSSIATAIKIGTESPSDFRNIHVSNCVIRDSTVGIGMYIKDGATAERITFSNCTIETIRRPELANDGLKNGIFPIMVDIEKRRPESRIGRIRDLTFSDLNIVSDNGILIQGMSTPNIENLVLRNINFRVDRPADYSDRKKHVGGSTQTTEDRRRTEFARQESYLTLANANGVTVDHLRMLIPEQVYGLFPRSALSLHNVANADLGHIAIISDAQSRPAPVLLLDNCRHALLSACRATPRTGVFLKVSGDKTTDISLAGNDLTLAATPVETGSDVQKAVVRQ